MQVFVISVGIATVVISKLRMSWFDTSEKKSYFFLYLSSISLYLWTFSSLSLFSRSNFCLISLVRLFSVLMGLYLNLE